MMESGGRKKDGCNCCCCLERYLISKQMWHSLLFFDDHTLQVKLGGVVAYLKENMEKLSRSLTAAKNGK